MKTWTIQNLETNHNGYDWPTFAIRSQPGNHCLAVVGEMDNATAPFNAANARLIAAAPDLLAALQGLFEHCAMIHKHGGDGDNQKQANAAEAAARAAIAKATA